jgi:hypothetical protein
MEYIEFWPRLPFARQSGVKFWTQVTRKDIKNNSIDSYVVIIIYRVLQNIFMSCAIPTEITMSQKD